MRRGQRWLERSFLFAFAVGSSTPAQLPKTPAPEYHVEFTMVMNGGESTIEMRRSITSQNQQALSDNCSAEAVRKGRDSIPKKFNYRLLKVQQSENQCLRDDGYSAPDLDTLKSFLALASAKHAVLALIQPQSQDDQRFTLRIMQPSRETAAERGKESFVYRVTVPVLLGITGDIQFAKTSGNTVSITFPPPSVVSYEALIKCNNCKVKPLRARTACPLSPPSLGGYWRSYIGLSDIFHCGFKTYLENREPTPDDPIAECVYDNSNKLVDRTHPQCDCQGTPDQYAFNHLWNLISLYRHTHDDLGGVYKQGGPALAESVRYGLEHIRQWIFE